ncbi:MAG: hypothetical protein H7Z43_02230 [Clostridia bacterium]|nr:hypothetical protein [Deltaproteobacteria bacterium]
MRIRTAGLTFMNICLFSHFDAVNYVARHVFKYVEALAASGFRIHFVTTCSNLPLPQRERLEEVCASFAMRANRGFDFGSWQYALRHHPDILMASEVLLANDSVYLVGDIAATIARARTFACDVVGLTDSTAHAWHLQSYFLLFKTARAIRELLPTHLSSEFAEMSKRELIEAGEIGFGRRLVRGNYKAAAVFPFSSFDRGRYLRPRNPTHFYWDRLLKNGFPFVKVELLRDNPAHIDITTWRDRVPDVAIIEEHLRAVGRPDKRTPRFLKRRVLTQLVRQTSESVIDATPIGRLGLRLVRRCQRAIGDRQWRLTPRDHP